MTLIEKFNIHKSRWQEYRKCKKMLNQATRDLDNAENKIFTSVTFESEVTEYDWPADAPCKRKLYNDFNGPVDSDTPPLACNIFEYPSYCENFPGCTKTGCQHYQNYLKYVDSREKWEKAKEACGHAKAVLKEHVK